MVLNLVSSTLPCIRQPGPRLPVFTISGITNIIAIFWNQFQPLPLTEMEDQRASVTDALQSTTFRLYSSAASPVTDTRCLGAKAQLAAPPWVGSRSPDGWDQIPYRPGGWVLHQTPWSFGFDSQTRGTKENRRPLC